MAEAALFIGWGAPVRGREGKSLEIFSESIQYWGGLQQDGRIAGFEVVLPHPPGGDLYGFALLRGSHDQLNEVGGDDEFLRLTARAGLIVEGLGVVRAVVGEGFEQQIERFQRATSDLPPQT